MGRIMTDGYAVSALVSPTNSLNTASCRGASPIEEIQQLWEQTDDAEQILRIGIDPGFTDVITACYSDGRSPLSYSSSRYYETAKIKHSSRHTSKFNEQTKAMTDQLLATQGCRTSYLHNMASYLEVYLKVLVPLLKNRMQQQYRKFRFLRHIFKKTTVVEIVDLIVGKTSSPPSKPLILVGFGNWSGGHSSPISRKHAGPIQSIKEEIAKRPNTQLCNVDEHKSSQVNCKEWTKMRNMKAITHRRNKDGSNNNNKCTPVGVELRVTDR